MKKNIKTEDTIKRWDNFAETYSKSHTEQGDVHKEIFLNPTLFSLMGTVKNKKILDAGCGEGYLSRLLAKSDANVTAVDYSPKMIEIARERTPNELSIHYIKGNCEDLHSLEDASFDLIVSNMVIHDLENYKKNDYIFYLLIFL